MVCRLSPLFELSPNALTVVTYVGAATAIFAATVGTVQNDIKRVIAYSTCSQLGYMFFAAGVGAYGAAMFDLFTHAFFKALLFLGAGSVIHAMHHEQDMRFTAASEEIAHLLGDVTIAVAGDHRVGCRHRLRWLLSKDAIIRAPSPAARSSASPRDRVVAACRSASILAARLPDRGSALGRVRAYPTRLHGDHRDHPDAEDAGHDYRSTRRARRDARTAAIIRTRAHNPLRAGFAGAVTAGTDPTGVYRPERAASGRASLRYIWHAPSRAALGSYGRRGDGGRIAFLRLGPKHGVPLPS